MRATACSTLPLCHVALCAVTTHSLMGQQARPNMLPPHLGKAAAHGLRALVSCLLALLLHSHLQRLVVIATATLVVVMALMMEMMAVAKQPMTREL